MTTTVQDLMRDQVIYLTPHQKLSHARSVFNNNRINSLPVVNSDMEVIGVVTSSDMVKASDKDDQAEVQGIMTESVYTIPRYENVSIAARMMRNHKIHHLLVTEEKKLVGIISSFDLLKLIEGKRFVMKNPSTPKKGTGKRKNIEAAADA